MSGPPPTDEQREAIAARAVDAFCEAGAGTGKTRVLVGRYCAALCDDSAGVDEILAFTFTERAAAELRGRIRGELNDRAADARAAGDPARARELRTLARATERAWISTIHGFCRRLLASHPVAAGLDPSFRVLDAGAAERLRQRAAREAVEGLAASGDERAVRVIAAYRSRFVREIVLAAHERLRSQGVDPPALPEVGPPKASSGEELTPEDRRAALDAHAVLQEVLRATHERYEELKRGRSSLDFLDLELRAVALLDAGGAAAEAWRGRFRHVMVDEFQDTNRLQLRLIELLRGPETRLFTVGDEHQSIYRFRNADLAVFREAREAARRDRDTRILPLRGNFRARPELLGVVNALGERLLPGFEGLAKEREPAGDGPRVDLLLTLDEGQGRSHRKWKDVREELCPPRHESSTARVAQARALAERLRELVEDPEAGVEAGDIVVLLRAFTHVDAYEEALERYGLDPYVVGGRGYWSQQQVEDVLRLLAVVANPLDDEMLFGALAGPACGASPDALWLLRRATGAKRHVWPTLDFGFGEGREGYEPAAPEWLERIEGSDAERLRSFCATLRALRAEAPVLTLDRLVERTLEAFRYDLSALALPGGAGRMANVRKLMRLAAEFERDEGRDLRGFLELAAESTKRDEREGLAPVRAEEHPGVRIMTVHGAKGLEFPVVAVPELDRKLDAGHSWAYMWIGRVGPEGAHARFGLRLAFPTAGSRGCWELTELEAEEREAEAEESCRLVYVAATRAQERLVLSGVYKPAHTEPLAEDGPSDSALARVLPELLRRDDVLVRRSEPTPERARELAARRDPVAAAGPADAAGPPPLLARGPSPVPVGHLSYSALDAYQACGYRFYLERVLGLRPGMPVAPVPHGAGDGEDAPARGEDGLPPAGAPGPGPRAALGLGNAVHSALEWSARNGWADPGADRLRALLAQEGLADAERLERAARLVRGWLESPLRAELEGWEIAPEAPFVLRVGEDVLRGSIDLLARRDGETVVVDYKTDRLGAAGPAERGSRYAAQRSVYALAAADPRGGEVRAAHLFCEAPGEPVVERFDAAALAGARERLAALLARIRAGEFRVTDEPDEVLCLGCPAAARLCPNPAWRPGRQAPLALR